MDAITDADVARFWEKVDRSGECWTWLASQAGEGARTGRGYGSWAIRGTTYGAHRFSWILRHGPIPDGLEVDHLCHNRLCVNPDHMRLATRAQNAQNLSGAHADSRSGVRGVDWYAPTRKWRVRVRAHRKDHYGGYFTSIEAAAARAEELRRELHTLDIG